MEVALGPVAFATAAEAAAELAGRAAAGRGTCALAPVEPGTEAAVTAALFDPAPAGESVGFAVAPAAGAAGAKAADAGETRRAPAEVAGV